MKLVPITSGLVAALVVGAFCEKFLNRIQVPPDVLQRYKSLNPGDHNYYVTGGKDLGFLESVLFFASLWSREYVMAGAWLTVKLAAKWAAWQHVIKMPDKLDDNVRKTSR